MSPEILRGLTPSFTAYRATVRGPARVFHRTRAGARKGQALRALEERALAHALMPRVRMRESVAGKAPRRAAGAGPASDFGLLPMLSFSLTGTLACVLQTLPDEVTLAISSPLERPCCPPRMAWVLCIVRDRDLRVHVMECLRPGDQVRVEGLIEQRRRQVGALAFHSVAVIAESIQHLPSASGGEAP